MIKPNHILEKHLLLILSKTGISSHYASVESDVKSDQAIKIAKRYYYDALQKLRDLEVYGSDRRLIVGAKKTLAEKFLICEFATDVRPKLSTAWRAVYNGVGYYFTLKQYIKYQFPIFFHLKTMFKGLPRV